MTKRKFLFVARNSLESCYKVSSMRMKFKDWELDNGKKFRQFFMPDKAGLSMRIGEKEFKSLFPNLTVKRGEQVMVSNIQFMCDLVDKCDKCLVTR